MKNENDLLDRVAELIGARNDAQLARGLEVAPPVISKIRHGRLSVGAILIIKINEITDWPVAEIKSYLTVGQQAPRAAGQSVKLTVPYGVQPLRHLGEVHKGTMQGRPGNFQNLPKEQK